MKRFLSALLCLAIIALPLLLRCAPALAEGAAIKAQWMPYEVTEFFSASQFNGFSVKKYILFSFILSGVIAGVGGSAELLGTQFRLISGFGAGYGFDGVAMALIAQLHPLAAILVAIFFAALRVGSTTMQAATGVPTSVSEIIQALVIVFTVAGLAMVKLPELKAFIERLFPARKEA